MASQRKSPETYTQEEEGGGALGEVKSILRDMPKVHLKGLSNTSNDEQQASSRTEITNQALNAFDGCLVWQPDSDSPDHFVSRGVAFVRVNNQPRRVKAIVVQQTGIYVVYSQVIVNGTTRRTWRRDCAHQTVIVPQNDNARSPNHRVLLSGFVTQDSQGQYQNDSIPFPRDSSLQMGIFKLIRQTEVSVRVAPTEDCRLTTITTDLHSSYFGLYRIA